jgi:hypothetical protein
LVDHARLAGVEPAADALELEDAHHRELNREERQGREVKVRGADVVPRGADPENLRVVPYKAMAGWS